MQYQANDPSRRRLLQRHAQLVGKPKSRICRIDWWVYDVAPPPPTFNQRPADSFISAPLTLRILVGHADVMLVDG